MDELSMSGVTYTFLVLDQMTMVLKLYQDSASVLFCITTYMTTVYLRTLRREIDQYRTRVIDSSFTVIQPLGKSSKSF